MDEYDEEIILDQVKEIFNLGVGRASREISRLIDEEITLNVPFAKVVHRKVARDLLSIDDESMVTAIFQKFSGEVQGEVILVFQEERSHDLIRCLLHEDCTLEKMTELDEEAIADVSSIIVNSVLTAMSGVLSIELSSYPPDCVHGKLHTVLDGLFGDQFNDLDELLYVTISFSLKNKGVDGKLVFIQDMSFARQFLGYVARYLSEDIF